MFRNYYRGRKILVTGHTGFKGAWLSLWLHELGAEVSGFSDVVPTKPSLFEVIDKGTFRHDIRGDVSDAKIVAKAIKKTKPDLVFHLAAQPLVRLSYKKPLSTLQTNVMGTANVLEALRNSGQKTHVLVVTSDKCYENRNWDYGYRENDPLGGHDIYSASKGATEVMTHAWARSFFEPDKELGNVCSARAGNVVGGGDYAADRIIPDCVRALQKKDAIQVRNPKATRPWQHVLDCLSGYLWLGARVATGGKNSSFASAFNFGPRKESNRNVGELVEAVLQTWPGKWKHLKQKNAPHEAKLLHLSTDKATRELNWFPVWEFEETIHHTIEWYRRRHTGGRIDMREFSRQQIQAFSDAAKDAEQEWARK
ncbi:MAG: CDP-glucose 4,6-dehydratase [Verrucomicrobiales bacterium]|nr:CDP-glucose 4,6-dehydratase [Verrucomicrobiales bacterium]|tara:strand:- start:105 stop:1205 length:1101 start_codon:yes stop_codon:yes gene_type:complete